MARMPGAIWQGEHGSRLMTRHDIVCVHTIVGYAPAHAAHFSVKGDGTILQSRDTIYKSGANLEGNHRVIAIENEDHGPHFPRWGGTDVPALTPAQVQANAAILRWAHETHGVPLAFCPNSLPSSRGLAYHRQGIDGNFTDGYPGRVPGGETWTTSYGKVCPGTRRIGQLPDILAHATGGVTPEPPKEWDEMATKEEIRAEVQDVVRLEILRFAQKLMANRDNQAYNPADPEQAWLAEAVSIPQALDNIDGRLLRTVQALMGRSNTFLNPAEQPWLEESARLNDLDEKLDAVLAKLPG